MQLPTNLGNFTCGASHVKRPHTQYFCNTCLLPVKTNNFTFIYAKKTSRKNHANCLQPYVVLLEFSISFTSTLTCELSSSLHAKLTANARYKVRQFRVASPAACRIAYMKFASELFWGVVALTTAVAGNFAGKCGYCCLQLRVSLPVVATIFLCKKNVLSPAKAGVLHAICVRICKSFACKNTCKLSTIFR